jgi:uncharacterized paraquat-inducible protein A
MTIRTCPACGKSSIQTERLSQGAECPHCHAFIEVNAIYSFGIPILLALVAAVAFHFKLGVPGISATALLVLFTAGYGSVWVKYLPLKDYRS